MAQSGNDLSGVRAGSGRKGLGSSPHDFFRSFYTKVNGSNCDCTLIFDISSYWLCGAQTIQRHLAVRCIDEALATIETTKERWFEAEVHRVAGELALKSAEPDRSKAEAYFERALVVARQQQAKSWELRAAMSMARLWRDQGKRDEARELLAPVYGWFTEGFDTRDLKEGKALLNELSI